MPRPSRPLTDKAIRDTIRGVGNRAFPLWDGRGLHLIARDGGHHWRLKYRRPDGRENRLALGHYPEVSLAEARELALNARAELRRGIDPGAARKAATAHARGAAGRSFAVYGRKWLSIKTPGWSKESIKKNKRAVEEYLLPQLGRLDVGNVTTGDVLPVIRDADARSREYAITAASAARAIIRLAIAEGKRGEGRLLDLDLRNNLPRKRRGHFPAAKTPDELRVVLGVICDLPQPVTRAALMLCLYTAQRPGNIVSMRWDELRLDAGEWLIPAVKMKVDRDDDIPHVVPISTQASALIQLMWPLTGGVGYVFPPLAQQKNVHLAEDTLSSALRDAGLRGKQTPHGARATFRTVARQELGVAADVLEAQIAHAKKGQTQSAYDRAWFVPERHKVMQRWADYLDGLALGNQ